MSKAVVHLTELRDQDDDELRAALATTRDDLFRLHLGQYTNQVTSSASLQTKRRDIARIMTILRSRELGTEKQAEKKQVTTTTEAPAEVVSEKKSKKPATKTAKAKAK